MHRNGPPGHPNTYKFKGGGSCLLKSLRRFRLARRMVIASLAVIWVSGVLAGQSTAAPAPTQTAPANSQNQKDQGVPDAPSTVQPPTPAAENPLSAPANPGPPRTAPENQPPPRENAPEPQRTNPATPPPINLRTVPEGGATKEQATAQE